MIIHKTIVCLVLLIFLGISDQVPVHERLNEYISHYETLSYNQHEVHDAHQRVRRSAPNGNVHVRFQAHDRDFQLRLKRDVSTFSDRLEVLGPQGPLQVDTAHIYHGQLLGEPDSTVFGSVVDGVFEGKIVSPSGSFYVEKARHYFPHQHYNQSFHSVIYNEDHVEDPYQHKRQVNAGGCGITEDVRQWMEQIQNSANEKSSVLKSQQNKENQQQKKEESFHHKNPHDKYSKETNKNEVPHNRAKRAPYGRRDRTSCALSIQTDPILWKHVREGFPEHKDPSKENEVNELTRIEIMSIVAQHVTALNYIYRDTKFDGRNEHRDIKFQVQQIKIDDSSSCQCKYSADSCEINEFCNENITVTNFLNIHSLGNHEDFCLSYVFTYRDFTCGTLGLGWMSSASGVPGGICEKFKPYTESIGGKYQSMKRSLNTGIITFINYNSRVPPKVSQLMLAHEIGHNFGSPHDYPEDCRPGGLQGNFLMFASATSGERPNNSKFSSCSIRNISAVLDSITEYEKRNCFSSNSITSFCGNKIVELGEECDCGYDNNECNDKCCYPRIVDMEDRSMNRSAKGCTRRAKTQCSPSEGPCCYTDTCKYVPEWAAVNCKSESECSLSSTCNGYSAKCPMPRLQPDKTRCNNGTQLCIQGECSASICLEWNLTQCFLTSNIKPNTDKRQMCELACQNGTDPSTCRSTSELAHIVGLPPGGVSLRPGSPCDNFKGYCDEFLKCQAAEGPVDRMKNPLYNRFPLPHHHGCGRGHRDQLQHGLLVTIAIILVIFQ